MATLQVIDTLFSMESPSTVIHLAKCSDPVAECVAAMDEAGISKVVLAPCKRWNCERHWMCGDIQIDEVEQYVATHSDRFAGLAAYNPRAISESIEAVDNAIRRLDFRGVYVPWEGRDVTLQDACMYPLYARCVELNVPVMIEVGDSGESATKLLAALRKILADYSELKVVLAWPASADLNVMIAACKQHPALSVAFDGRVVEGQESMLKDWLTTEGADRCIWGSNGLPWKKLLQHLSAYSLPETVLKSFLYENAVRLFGLSSAIKTDRLFVNDRIIVAE
jgi:uncharacterized protein